MRGFGFDQIDHLMNFYLDFLYACRNEEAILTLLDPTSNKKPKRQTNSSIDFSDESLKKTVTSQTGKKLTSRPLCHFYFIK